MKCTLPGATFGCAISLLFAVVSIGSEIAGAALQQGRNAGFSSRTKTVDELYRRNCARCHGEDGRGDTPLGHVFNAPDFTDRAWWEKNDTSNRKLASIVARGKAGMPAFGKKLTKSEINLLVSRMRSFRK